MIWRTFFFALLTAGVLAASGLTLTVANADDANFADPAGDAVQIADDVLAFDPDINPPGPAVPGLAADITTVTASVGSTIHICVLRPNKLTAGPITHVEIILHGANLEARWKLDTGVLSTFVEDLDGTPVGGTGISIASADAGKTVCLDAPLSLAASITGIQAVDYDRPAADQLRGWDRTAVFSVQLQVPTATATATATSPATATATPTATTATATATTTPSATATVAATNTPTTAPTLAPATATPVPPTAVATATAVAPGPPATGNGPATTQGSNVALYVALALAVVGASGLTAGAVAKRIR